MNVLLNGVVPLFVAVKEGTLPVPEVAARPMAPAVRVQLYSVPGTAPVKAVAGTVWPTQYVLLATGLTVGVGFTVMVKVIGAPGHPLALGITVMVPVIGAVPAFVVVNGPMLPLPEAARPMAVLLLVQV